MPETSTMSFPMTRQGVRNLDAVDADKILPISGAPTAAQAFPTNVGEAERWLSTAAGSALVTFGLLRATKLSLIGALVGGAMIYRGVTGHCSLYQAMGHSTAAPADPTAVQVFRRG